MYTIAYVPYTRNGYEQIAIAFATTDKDVIEFIVDKIGCNVNDVEYVDNGVFYDYDGNPVDVSLTDCIKYLNENFVGDGSYGATLLTITEGTTIIYAG